jgi:hypothetical protein
MVWITLTRESVEGGSVQANLRCLSIVPSYCNYMQYTLYPVRKTKRDIAHRIRGIAYGNIVAAVGL